MREFLMVSERLHKFTLEEVVQGQKVKGEFEAKFPSITDEIKIDVACSKLLDGADPSLLNRQTYDMAYMVAYNQALLTKRPKWYDLNLLDDEAVIRKVFSEIVGFVDSFRQENAKVRNSENRTGSEDRKPVEGV